MALNEYLEALDKRIAELNNLKKQFEIQTIQLHGHINEVMHQKNWLLQQQEAQELTEELEQDAQ